MRATTQRKRPLVRWPFLVLAAVPIILTAALFVALAAHDRGAHSSILSAHAHMPTASQVEAWAITIGILAVMLAVPGRTYRRLILLALLLAILAALIL